MLSSHKCPPQPVKIDSLFSKYKTLRAAISRAFAKLPSPSSFSSSEEVRTDCLHIASCIKPVAQDHRTVQDLRSIPYKMDGAGERRLNRKAVNMPISSIFVHAGAGYHSTTNEHIHLGACSE